MKYSELKAAAKEKREAGKLSRLPRPGSNVFFLERDKTGRTYSVFMLTTMPGGDMAVTLVLDGALYQGARESVLKHTVEENARAVEREYDDVEVTS